jgi:pyridoxine/pyridoxamine 5'-phosphate oxidase
MNPLKEIIEFRKKASEKNDPMLDLCIFSTSNENFEPFVRTIELNQISTKALNILITDGSPKSRQLNSTNKFEVLLLWLTVPIQIRIRGEIKKLDKNSADKLWKKKDDRFKLLDYFHEHVKQQSQLITNEEIQNQSKKIKEKRLNILLKKIPKNISAYSISPAYIDIWMDNGGIFPERKVYKLFNKKWEENILMP